MPVTEGPGVGEYSPVIDGVIDGEDSLEEVFNRANRSLSNRTEALKDFANSSEVLVTDHISSSVQHGSLIPLLGTGDLAEVSSKSIKDVIAVDPVLGTLAAITAQASNDTNPCFYEATDGDKELYISVDNTLRQLTGGTLPGVTIQETIHKPTHGYVVGNTLAYFR